RRFPICCRPPLPPSRLPAPPPLCPCRRCPSPAQPLLLLLLQVLLQEPKTTYPTTPMRSPPHHRLCPSRCPVCLSPSRRRPRLPPPPRSSPGPFPGPVLGPIQPIPCLPSPERLPRRLPEMAVRLAH
ncbi:unnamed protein product, partial [Ectocarpus sp. 12 AP-2014]